MGLLEGLNCIDFKHFKKQLSASLTHENEYHVIINAFVFKEWVKKLQYTILLIN